MGLTALLPGPSVRAPEAAFEPAGEALNRAKAFYFDAWLHGREREAWPGITYVVVRPSWVRYSSHAAPTVINKLSTDIRQWFAQET